MYVFGFPSRSLDLYLTGLKWVVQFSMVVTVRRVITSCLAHISSRAHPGEIRRVNLDRDSSSLNHYTSIATGHEGTAGTGNDRSHIGASDTRSRATEYPDKRR